MACFLINDICVGCGAINTNRSVEVFAWVLRLVVHVQNTHGTAQEESVSSPSCQLSVFVCSALVLLRTEVC